VELVLATRDEQIIEGLKRNPVLDEILKTLLVRLRHITGQATIPTFRDCQGSFHADVDEIPIDYVPPELVVGSVQKYIVVKRDNSRSHQVSGSPRF
jgi:hypothetical protein